MVNLEMCLAEVTKCGNLAGAEDLQGSDWLSSCGSRYFSFASSELVILGLHAVNEQSIMESALLVACRSPLRWQLPVLSFEIALGAVWNDTTLR